MGAGGLSWLPVMAHVHIWGGASVSSPSEDGVLLLQQPLDTFELVAWLVAQGPKRACKRPNIPSWRSSKTSNQQEILKKVWLTRHLEFVFFLLETQQKWEQPSFEGAWCLLFQASILESAFAWWNPDVSPVGDRREDNLTSVFLAAASSDWMCRIGLSPSGVCAFSFAVMLMAAVKAADWQRNTPNWQLHAVIQA